MYLWQRVRNKVWLRVDWMTCDFHSLCEPKHLPGVENDSQGDICFRPMRLEDLATMRQYFPRKLSDRKYNNLKERHSEEGREAFAAHNDNRVSLKNYKANDFIYTCSTITIRLFGYVLYKVYMAGDAVRWPSLQRCICKQYTDTDRGHV